MLRKVEAAVKASTGTREGFQQSSARIGSNCHAQSKTKRLCGERKGMDCHNTPCATSGDERLPPGLSYPLPGFALAWEEHSSQIPCVKDQPALPPKSPEIGNLLSQMMALSAARTPCAPEQTSRSPPALLTTKRHAALRCISLTLMPKQINHPIHIVTWC